MVTGEHRTYTGGTRRRKYLTTYCVFAGFGAAAESSGHAACGSSADRSGRRHEGMYMLVLSVNLPLSRFEF